MTITGSGQVAMSDINVEFGLSATLANSSITDASTGGGSYPAINTSSPSYPDGSTPHSYSEFYSYNHSAGPSVTLTDWWCDGTGDIVYITGSSSGGPKIKVKVTEFLTETSQSFQPTDECWSTGSGGNFSGSVSLVNSDTDAVNIVVELYSGSCTNYANAFDSDVGVLCSE